MQGDVIAILNKSAQVVAKYSYDAWGVCTVTQDTSDCGIATINPFRYRSYYYDNEIGIYYLQSRYYNPTVGRFVNGDDADMIFIASETTYINLFFYCNNSPVKDWDFNGNLSFSSVKKGISDIVNNIKSFITNLLNYIKKQFNKFINKVACRFNKGYLTIITAPIGYFIDAIISTISGIVKGTLLRGGFSLIKLWFKSNKPALKTFVTNTVVPMLLNTRLVIESLIKYIASRLARKCAITITKSKIQDRILGKYDFYKWISAVSSIGSFIATVLDILDGKWDGKLAI